MDEDRDLSGVEQQTGEGDAPAEGRLDIHFELDPQAEQKGKGAAEGAEFQPSVLIGLGGTGAECLRRLKARLVSRVGKPLPIWSFVCVDADTGAWAPKPGLADLLPAEQCFIGGGAIAPIVEHPRAHDWLLDEIPDGLQPAHYQEALQGEGCGQMRAVGHVALLASHDNVKRVLENAIVGVRRLASTRKAREGVRAAGGEVGGNLFVYVVGSLAGGTGSGTLVGATMLARHLAGRDAQIIGLLALPGVFDEKVKNEDERQTMRMNAYAALRELQALQDGLPHDLEVQTGPGGARLVHARGQKFFDRCYLIDFRNERGQGMTKSEDTYELVARFLAHELATPFGVRMRSAARNWGTRRGTIPCPVTGKPRQLGTFSTSALRIPIERLFRYCTWRGTAALIHDRVLGRGLDLAGVEQRARGFLTAHDLDERGKVDQVQERLLRDAARRRRADADLLVDGSAALLKKEASAFVAHVQQCLDHADRDGLARVERTLEGNLAHYLGGPRDAATPLDAWLDAALGGWLAQDGAVAAAQALKSLEADLRAFDREMQDENAAWDARREKLAAELKTDLDRLRGMNVVWQKLVQEDDRLKRTSRERANALIEGRVLRLARVAAQKVYQRAVARVAARRAEIDAFVASAGALQRELQASTTALELESRRASEGFVLEMDATDADFLTEFAAAHPVDHDAVLKAARGRRKPEEFHLDLARKDRVQLLKALGDAVREACRPAILELDVVDLVARRAKDRDALSSRLETLFASCLPFWRTVVPTIGTRYQEFVAIGCRPTPGSRHEAPRFPAALERWTAELKGGGDHGLTDEPTRVPTSAPWEIEMVRYTYGARAWYLADTAAWRQLYAAHPRGTSYPLHVLKALEQTPDLMPDAAALAREAFAVGLALGFIAKRGEHYYLNVREERDDSGQRVYAVPYHTEWTTVFGPADARALPPGLDGFRLQFRNAKPPERDALGQGRSKARAAFEKTPEHVGLVQAALEAYVGSAGTAVVRRQLSAYADTLETMDVPSKVRDLVAEERDTVARYARELE